MRYGRTGGWLDDQPAVLSRRVGRGTITYLGYLGAWFDPTLMTTVLNKILDNASVKPITPNLPPSVEAMQRSGDGKTVLIIINHGNALAMAGLPRAATDVLQQQQTSITINLPAHQIGVYRLK